jgi:heme/copper-type cytochrome/quinol oxidase subunit 2
MLTDLVIFNIFYVRGIRRMKGIRTVTIVVLAAFAALSTAYASGQGERWKATSFVVPDQALYEGTIAVSWARIPEAGWIVIREEESGQFGRVVGYKYLEAGKYQNLQVPLDSTAAPLDLIAALHVDAGIPEKFEFPGPDSPVMAGAELVTAAFRLVPRSEVVRLELRVDDSGFEPARLRVQKGDVVELHLVSESSTHGFGLPQYGINEMMRRGKDVVVRFTADKRGRFQFKCTTFCGEMHTKMRGSLIVE